MTRFVGSGYERGAVKCHRAALFVITEVQAVLPET